MLCLAFAPNDTTYAGTLNGDIYMWGGNNLHKVIQSAHAVSVYQCYSLRSIRVKAMFFGVFFSLFFEMGHKN